MIGLKRFPRGCTIGRRHHFVAGFNQQFRILLADKGLIIHDQYPVFALAGRPMATSPEEGLTFSLMGHICSLLHCKEPCVFVLISRHPELWAKSSSTYLQKENALCATAKGTRADGSVRMADSDGQTCKRTSPSEKRSTPEKPEPATHRSRFRQREVKSSPTVDRPFGPDSAPMATNDSFYICQAKSNTLKILLIMQALEYFK